MLGNFIQANFIVKNLFITCLFVFFPGVPHPEEIILFIISIASS